MKSTFREQLPEGIEETLPEQAHILERHRGQLLSCLERWGYQPVSPPLAEFLETLVTGEEALDHQTFRLPDPLSGRMLGVRADITPQIARIDRQHMPQDRAVRLCYVGPVLRAHPEILGGGRNPVQAGAELYGHDGIESDAEIVLLLCAALRAAGCTSWCLDMGHAGVFRAVAERAAWSEEERRELSALIQRKAHPDIADWLQARQTEAGVADLIRALPTFSGPDEIVLDQALAALGDVREAVAGAIESLRVVAGQVRAAYPEVRLHFDLAEASGFHYESGLVFAVYMEGEGQEIARGGRYRARDARPAVGFSLDLRTLARCGSLPEIACRRVYARCTDDLEQQATIDELRVQGAQVICALDADDTAARLDCTEELVQERDAWVTRLVNS